MDVLSDEEALLEDNFETIDTCKILDLTIINGKGLFTSNESTNKKPENKYPLYKHSFSLSTPNLLLNSSGGLIFYPNDSKQKFKSLLPSESKSEILEEASIINNGNNSTPKTQDNSDEPFLNEHIHQQDLVIDTSEWINDLLIDNSYIDFHSNETKTKQQAITNSDSNPPLPSNIETNRMHSDFYSLGLQSNDSITAPSSLNTLKPDHFDEDLVHSNKVIKLSSQKNKKLKLHSTSLSDPEKPKLAEIDKAFDLLISNKPDINETISDSNHTNSSLQNVKKKRRRRKNKKTRHFDTLKDEMVDSLQGEREEIRQNESKTSLESESNSHNYEITENNIFDIGTSKDNHLPYNFVFSNSNTHSSVNGSNRASGLVAGSAPNVKTTRKIPDKSNKPRFHRADVIDFILLSDD
ncbi:hypothetical protein BB560_001522 [Smittium megazygosporum]|uniref:Uncharacterized protein n=1 Tax=Smittium megazygosporum TaxID=133381 RepID=A0A2T9ZHC6_9FUNG|nr:hypothetical protein BB560_001522 [Smittium megazygosporum]